MSEVINMEVVDELLSLSEDGDPELLVDLIQMYLEDGPRKLEEIVDDQIWPLPKYRELLFLR